MKYKVILVLLIISMTKSSLAQEMKPYKNKLEFHVMPFSLLNFMPRLRMGFEYYTKEKTSYSFDFGYSFSSFVTDRANWILFDKDYDCYELRAEIKYLYLRKPKFEIYNSLDAFFVTAIGDLYNEIYFQDGTGNRMEYAKATLRKSKTGLNLKFGWKGKSKKGFTIDCYTGFGFAYRRRIYQNLIDEPYIPSSTWGLDLEHPDKFEGDELILDITWGIKLGYLLFKSK